MLEAISDDPASYSLEQLKVDRTDLPVELKVGREIGKGANNKVFRAKLREQPCVLRAPRRRSDTQNHGSALWEFRHVLKASQLGVGAKVYDAWYAKHAHGRWTSGLYMVLEHFDNDLQTVLFEQSEKAKPHFDAFGTSLVDCIKKLAQARIFVYDLKPSNIMVHFGETPEVRIIDFGRDFCEWGGCADDPDGHTPVIDMLRNRIKQETKDEEEAESRLCHILFTLMITIAAATTTREMLDGRHEHRMGSNTRSEVNFVARRTGSIIDEMQGRDVALMKHAMRTDAVRGVLQHYHGRRNAGTRRTLRFAHGVER